MRILLVEDELKVAEAIGRGLRHEGYAVDMARDGEEALLNARVYEYDAVVLDLMIPGPDGFEVCRALRNEGRWSPVLMLTARDGVHDRIGGLDAGADDYLVKPFAFGELLARLRSLVRRRPNERPSVLVAGDLSLDPATRAVSRAGQAVDLSPREFALLEYLMHHRDEVVSRTVLLDHVWDQNFLGSTNVVDVYVGYLRKKLERPFGRTLIRTVRGAGYTLEAG